MYLYFDKLGVLKTIIPHGEIPRQGSDLNIFVCFDQDFFGFGEEYKDYNVNIELILPNNQVGTNNILPRSVDPNKIFYPVSSSEVTYDFIPGVGYLTYHFKFGAEQSTAIAGKVIANVSIVRINQKENGESENITEYFGRAEIFVEKTFGAAKVTVNEASLHYKNLVDQINRLTIKFGDYVPLVGNSLIDGSLTSNVCFSVKEDENTKTMYFDSYIQRITESNVGGTSSCFYTFPNSTGHFALEENIKTIDGISLIGREEDIKLKTINGEPITGSGDIIAKGGIIAKVEGDTLVLSEAEVIDGTLIL